jgi:hypothetical protein
MADKEPSYKLPPTEIWGHISKLAIVEDKPIMLDYWTDSLAKQVLIGVKKGTESEGEKLLVKNAEEYTSPIIKIYKVNGCYIICTENSIYLVSSDIPTKHINA